MDGSSQCVPLESHIETRSAISRTILQPRAQFACCTIRARLLPCTRRRFKNPAGVRSVLHWIWELFDDPAAAEAKLMAPHLTQAPDLRNPQLATPNP